MKHGIINIAAQQTIVQTSTDCYDWSMCNNIAGHSPAIIFDLSHPAEDLNQRGGAFPDNLNFNETTTYNIIGFIAYLFMQSSPK
jgi:hypothetical protein